MAETFDEQLEQIRQASELSRKSNQEVIQGHIDASSQVVAQVASMAATEALRNPDFTQP